MSIVKQNSLKATKEFSVFLFRQLKNAFFWVYSFMRNIWLENPYSIVVFAIMILAAYLRTSNLTHLPEGLAQSELEIIKKSKEIAESGKLWLGNDFKEGLYLYVGAAVVKFFGAKIYFFRSLSALLGILTVLLTYLFAKEWFNKQTAFLSGLFTAFSSWHIAISRNIDPAVLQPLLILLIFYFASHAFRTKKTRYVILSALFLGLSIYAGTNFLLLPVLLLFAALYFYSKNRKFLGAYIKEISIAFNVFLIVTFPYFLTAVKNARFFLSEYKISAFSSLLANFGSIISSIFSYADSNYFFNLGTEALLDPFMGVLFFVGLVFAVFNLESRKNFFLLSWIVLMIIPGIFSFPLYLTKLSVIIPAIMMLAAVVLDHLFNEWFTTFPLNRKARVFMFLLSMVFFALSFSYNYKKYFIAWSGSEKVKETYSADISLIK